MFPDPNGGAEPPEEVRQIMERADETLVEDLQAIGLYVNTRVVAAHDAEDDVPGPRAGLMLGGAIGEVAFSDRVLHPEADRDDEILAEIADATVTDEYERTRRRLLGDLT